MTEFDEKIKKCTQQNEQHNGNGRGEKNPNNH